MQTVVPSIIYQIPPALFKNIFDFFEIFKKKNIENKIKNTKIVSNVKRNRLNSFVVAIKAFFYSI